MNDSKSAGGIGLAAFIGMAVATVLILALAIGATARPRWGDRGGSIFDRIELSDETRARVDAAQEESRSQGEPLREALRVERETLRGLLGEDVVDTGAALQQVERVGQARIALDKHRVATDIEIRSFMNDDERAAYEEARQKRDERKRKLRQRLRSRFGSSQPVPSGSPPDDLTFEELAATPLP